MRADPRVAWGRRRWSGLAAGDPERFAVRAWIYDSTFRQLTTRWYAEVLDRLPQGALLLDVGIGTAGALARNAARARARDVHVVGVDIDGDYLERARLNLERARITDRVRLRHISIFDFQEREFDAAYFSASFMLLPDPASVLRHVTTLLKPGGPVFFTQTFEEHRSPLVEKIKPMLHKVTTIDFGQVTYEADFLRTLEEGGCAVEENIVLGGGKVRTARLVVARPVGG
jgi:ubiquinone/menaquinone biosynthesis C-methylase UbiE